MLCQIISYPPLAVACNYQTYSGIYVQTTTTVCNTACKYSKKKLQNLPNDDAEDENNSALLNILLGLRNLLRVFSGK